MTAYTGSAIMPTGARRVPVELGGRASYAVIAARTGTLHELIGLIPLGVDLNLVVDGRGFYLIHIAAENPAGVACLQWIIRNCPDLVQKVTVCD